MTRFPAGSYPFPHTDTNQRKTGVRKSPPRSTAPRDRQSRQPEARDPARPGGRVWEPARTVYCHLPMTGRSVGTP